MNCDSKTAIINPSEAGYLNGQEESPDARTSIDFQKRLVCTRFSGKVVPSENTVTTLNLMDRMEELDIQELLRYCEQTSTESAKEASWEDFLAKIFPEIYSFAKGISFSILETDKEPDIPFRPLRELSYQLVSVSNDSYLVGVLICTLRNESLSQIHERYKENVRVHFLTLSFFLASISREWRRYLVSHDDSLVSCIPLASEEIEELLSDNSINSYHLTRRYLSSYKPVDDLLVLYSARAGKDKVIQALLEDPRTDPAVGAKDVMNKADQQLIQDINAIGPTETKVTNYRPDYNLALRPVPGYKHFNVVELLWHDKRVRKHPVCIIKILYSAIAEGRMDIIKTVWEDPEANLAIWDEFALVHAVQYGHLDVVKFLVQDAGISPAKKFCTRYYLDFAIDKQYVAILEFLLMDKELSSTVNYNRLFRRACREGSNDIIRFLLRKMSPSGELLVDPNSTTNEWDTTSLAEAASAGHLDTVKLLLSDSRVDPSINNNVAFRNAVISKRSEIVRLLLSDPRVDPTALNNRALRSARDVKTIGLLLSDKRVLGSASEETLEWAYAVLKESWQARLEKD